MDVAAMGQGLFQQSLQDNNYEDVLTQKITRDKEISLSLITFFVLMHDLGKFSYRFQRMDKSCVKKFRGREFETEACYVDHDELGLLLCQKEICPKILQENWLCLNHIVDKYYLQEVLNSWFHSVTMHHGRRSSTIRCQDYSYLLGKYFMDENIENACEFVEEASKFVLDNKLKKPFLKIDKSLEDTYNHTSKFLNILTRKSDQLVSGNPKYFHIPSTGIIKDYWNKAIRHAKLAIKTEKIDPSKIIAKNRYFFRKRDLIVDCL